MFKYLISLILAFAFMVVLAEETDTTGRRRLYEINTKIEEKLNKGERCNDDYFNENLLPLLKEVIDKGRIWDDEKPVEELPSFQSFLASRIGSHLNPYFKYAWWCYTSSERFKRGGTESRQKTCHAILTMLGDDLSRYSMFREYLFFMLFKYCGKNEYFNKENRKLALKYLANRKDKISIHLLLFLDKQDLDKEMMDYVTMRASQVPDFTKPPRKYKHFPVGMFYDNRIPVVSLVFLAKEGSQEHLARLLALLRNVDGRFIDFETTDRLLPYLVFIKKPEVVFSLTEYLKDDAIIDQGDDVMNRYTGYWKIAAFSLYMMLEGFPQITSMNCEMSHHKINAERLKCLEWLEKHPLCQFKESIAWESSDDITNHMRGWIFGR